ncbi:MAG: 3-isopropylmalate dehydratase small subunit [Candidatus Edwardsbacteria bacterium]|nr:3-isopropylmalate dehydratase small subunit [Candidatus Edwardsbacteria bacterium]MBU1576144.1 3-isopropylmalate dehydratase small subunit [Candidatus Edwardsbacteria bacterium]MBU2464224.1 3-isopropylmalate dehydratase small subunit [Candidatus Edwardsbacteria bacterium]MBU2593184.1 3-isopropylmalate dehydratase small subunit [Candidatus Edwardsbacteria bacterium]
MGKVVLKLGADISTDIIYPGRFMATVLPTETPQFAFVDDAAFNQKLKSKQIEPGSFIVADKNFGCGSSREQAASCLVGWGLKVIAKNFSRIFLQNSINVGLYMVICPTIEASEGDELVVEGGNVRNVTTGKEFPIVPLPQARQAIIDAGGLIPYTRKMVLAGKK